MAIASLIYLKNTEITNLNEYPNNLHIFFVHLIAPSMAVFVASGSFFTNKNLRRTLIEEIIDLKELLMPVME
jgi:hypothetical protein